MPEAPFDVSRAHRWFAVECNNSAWDLLESSGRSAEDSARLIEAAHAASFHWRAVGNELNRLRALNLLATAYVAVQDAAASVRYAEQVLAALSVADAQATAFDSAAAHGCAAAAFRLAGRNADAQVAAVEAAQFAATLDADDRAVFERLYPA